MAESAVDGTLDTAKEVERLWNEIKNTHRIDNTLKAMMTERVHKVAQGLQGVDYPVTIIRRVRP